MKYLMLAALAVLVSACEFENSESATKTLPIGLFRTKSPVQVSQVDSQGFQKNWIDTAEFFIHIMEKGKWEQFERMRDSCVYWRAYSDYSFASDTIHLKNTHGISYKTLSPKCQEVAYEYDRDTTIKIEVIGFTNGYVDLPREDPFSRRILRYEKVTD